MLARGLLWNHGLTALDISQNMFSHSDALSCMSAVGMVFAGMHSSFTQRTQRRRSFRDETDDASASARAEASARANSVRKQLSGVTGSEDASCEDASSEMLADLDAWRNEAAQARRHNSTLIILNGLCVDSLAEAGKGQQDGVHYIA